MTHNINERLNAICANIQQADVLKKKTPSYWDYAVKQVAKALREEGRPEAERQANLWRRNMGIDPKKLLAAAETEAA